MSRTINILVVLFIVQLVVVGALSLQQDEIQDKINKQALLDFAPGQIDKIQISSNDEQVVLSRTAEGWNLPDYFSFPVTPRRVKSLLEKLAGLKPGWPVATTDAAAKRFKVSDGEYERKLELYQGELLVGTLYIGTSPGLRKVHVRKANAENIHDVTFSAFDASVKLSDWRDASLLKLTQKDITKIRFPNFNLTKDGDIFLLDGLADGEVVAQEKVASYEQKLTTLNFASVVGAEAKATYNQADPLQLLTVESKSETLEYRLSKSSDGQYVLKRSDQPYFFILHEAVALPLIVNEMSQFLVQPESESVEAEGMPAEIDSPRNEQ